MSTNPNWEARPRSKSRGISVQRPVFGRPSQLPALGLHARRHVHRRLEPAAKSDRRGGSKRPRSLRRLVPSWNPLVWRKTRKPPSEIEGHMLLMLWTSHGEVPTPELSEVMAGRTSHTARAQGPWGAHGMETKRRVFKPKKWKMCDKRKEG